MASRENADSTQYDETVAAAVRKFQSDSDLKATGVLDNQTIRAMNSPKRGRTIDLVVANMERWRWLPRELGEPKLGNAYVMLNIPDFTLKVMHNGAQAWTTRVVTGKPGKQATPELSETMKFITVNPTWNVPPSIVYNEYLPALQQDPTVLERMGLRLSQNRDGSVHISQPPGAGNALGRIRFNFPNKFLVYQHDTPDKHLFAHDTRAYSHGCMRVQNPDNYAETLLGIAHAEGQLLGGEDPQHVRQQRDRHPLPDADSGAHRLSHGLRGRRRPPADPQGHLRPRRPPARGAAQRRPAEHGSRRQPRPAELWPAADHPSAGRRRRKQFFGAAAAAASSRPCSGPEPAAPAAASTAPRPAAAGGQLELNL